MSKIQVDQRSSFFPTKPNINSPSIKNSSQMMILPRNNAERQIEIKNKTENDAQVNIPDAIKDFARIKRAVDLAPEIDNSEKVSKLKEKIKTGDYQVDYDAIANKILLNEF